MDCCGSGARSRAGKYSIQQRMFALTNFEICSCAPAWKSLLIKPLRKLSSRLSSLRTPSNSPDSSAAAKPSVFHPIRSLPWFQITRLNFERTERQPDEYSLQDLEKGSNRSIVRSSHEQLEEIEDDSGGRDHGLHDSIDPTIGPVTPRLQMDMRRSIDQSSLHLNESPVLPGEWLSDGTPPRSSPRRRNAL